MLSKEGTERREMKTSILAESDEEAKRADRQYVGKAGRIE